MTKVVWVRPDAVAAARATTACPPRPSAAAVAQGSTACAEPAGMGAARGDVHGAGAEWTDLASAAVAHGSTACAEPAGMGAARRAARGVGAPRTGRTSGAAVAHGSTADADQAGIGAAERAARGGIGVPGGGGPDGARTAGSGSGWKLVAREFGELLAKIAAIVGLVVLVFAFVFGVERMGDAGMDPAVKGGDLVVFYRMGADYRADDVVVLDKQGVGRQVRRVVAVAGDTVDATDQGLTVNGGLLDLGLAEGEQPPVDPSIFPVTLAPGQLFVLGDALGAAHDSRSYGAVSSEDVEGEVVVLIRRRGF